MASAEQFVRTFMSFAERGDEAALSSCLAPSAGGVISPVAWARTHGAERLETASDEPWYGTHEVVRVTAWLRDGSPVAWPAGETRWFQAHATESGWRLESITAQHPRPSEDEIWQIVVRALPANTLVLRPTWLPDDFSPRLAYLWGTNTMSTPTYWLDYRAPSSGRTIAFHRGGGNSAQPTSTERISFHGAEAILATTASWPGIELTWSEDGYSYQIQMSKGTRDEILHVADALTAMTLTTNDQCAADPTVIARTDFVIERYYQLSNGGSVAAISDCFARIYRESNRNFTESAQVWSAMGPAFGVAIERLDSVNGCERFKGSATMRGSAQQATSYFVIGPESGRTRIYAIQTALAAPELETTRCQ